MLEVLKLKKNYYFNIFFVGGLMTIMISCGDNNYFQEV
jgi:hypothetical protein